MRFLVFHISSMIMAMLREMVHCSHIGMGELGGAIISFIISSLEFKREASILKPQKADDHRVLAKWHSKKRWILVSAHELQRMQVGSTCWSLRCKLALVGI